MNPIETLRAALKRDKRSVSAIAEESGVDRGVVWRFVHEGERGLTIRTAEKLCGVLGLELRIVPRRSPRRRPANK